ncbi:DUF1592 domain-containing protein [Verrucomicrobia bacterium]|nr:DUF1592 domain-containing protein [Verrucomicrobiota bacterium]
MRKFSYLVGTAFLWLGGLAGAADLEVELPARYFALLDSYCLDCHDGETQKGKVNLEALPFKVTTLEQAELWQKVLNAMNAGEMPPEKKPQPKNAEKADFLDDLVQTMVFARKKLSDSGGKITMRRLNRREYHNTIESLTGVNLDVSSLPSDGGTGTFDTVGASQFISSDQFEQYLKLGRIAIDEVFERRKLPSSKPFTFRVEPEKTINPKNEKFIKQVEERQERFKRWKKGVDEAAKTPENQAIIAEIRKTNRLIDHPNRFYTFADRFVGTPNPRDLGFIDSAKAAAAAPSRDRSLALHKHYASLPHRDTGTYLKPTHGTGRVIVAPKKVPAGSYVLRVRVGSVKGAPASRRFIEIGHPQREIRVRDWGLKGKPISVHQVTGTVEEPEIIEIPIEVRSDTLREFAVQEKQPNNGNLKVLWDEHNKLKKENGYGHPPAIWVDWIEWEGPLPKAGTKAGLARTLTDNLAGPKESESERARKILSDFSLTAFRQVKPAPKFIDQLLDLFKTRRAAGEPFKVAIRTPLSVILASPGFLYLNEPSDEKQRRTLTDRELAVRLAYFLWSAPPDAELLALAEKNALHKPTTLRQQVSRLLADSRSDEFVSGFVHQWLHMERLDFFQFDTKLHPEFDDSVRASARREVYESFAHLLRDPKAGRLGKLLKSDYVMINGLLANYYGIKGVNGDEFRKVKLPAGSPRGGLLGTAAIHAMGSDGVESSPVERGAWILRYLLNDPPPPAPPNVPQLSRLADKPIATRQRLRAHQEEAQCASCHRKIDPIGFGLENFDAAGKWRTTEAHRTKVKRSWRTIKTWEIDASGAFYKGPAFADYFELRDRIAEREPDFVRGFTEALIGYSLGRPFGFTDEELAQEILTAAKAKQYSVSEFIKTLVSSEKFRRK